MQSRVPPLSLHYSLVTVWSTPRTHLPSPESTSPHRRLGQESWLELTYFRDRLENEVNGFVFDPVLGVITADNESGVSQRQGIELALRAALGEQVQLSASYTYTDATQPSGSGGDDEEVRRPRHTANARLHYSPRQVPIDLLLNLAHVGSQVDLFFPPFPEPQQRVRLDSYLLADVTARYRIAQRVELFGRLENALDEQYEDVYGFATPGIGAYMGIRFFHGSGGRGVARGERTFPLRTGSAQSRPPTSIGTTSGMSPIPDQFVK